MLAAHGLILALGASLAIGCVISVGPDEDPATPGDEDPGTPGDEDPGTPGEEATPDRYRHVWSKSFLGGGDKLIHDIAIDGDGNIVIVGGFQHGMDLGGEQLEDPEDAYSSFVAKLDSAGNHLWSKVFKATYLDLEINSSADNIAVDGSGQILVAGSFQGSIDLGGATITTAINNAEPGAYLVKLDGEGGHLWSMGIEGPNNSIDGVAFDDAGNAYVAGSFATEIHLGDQQFLNNGDMDAFVAKVDAAGGFVWSKRFGGASLDEALAIKVDPAGDLVVGGTFQDTVDFGGGPFDAKFYDIFVLKLDAAGNHLWSKGFGGPLAQHLSGLAVDGAGEIAFTGRFEGEVDFGGGALSAAPAEAGDDGAGFDVYVAKLGADGGHRWSQRFGDGRWQEGTQVAALPSGEVFIAGYDHGAIDLGGAPGIMDLGNQLFAAKFDPSGAPTWMGRFGHDVFSPLFQSLVVTESEIVLAGNFIGNDGELDMGGGPLPHSGPYFDAFLAKLAPEP